jgi:hypothetical protein
MAKAKKEKYDGLFNCPASDGNFLSGIERLDDDDLQLFYDEIMEREEQERCHKGRIKAIEKELRSRKKKPLPAISPEVETMALVAQNQKAELAAIEETDRIFGDGKPYERIRLENEVRFYQDQAGFALLEMGKRLILLKEHERGTFLKVLENVDMSIRGANYAMSAARKFGNSQTFANLGSSKMIALTVLDDDQIQTLEDGGDVNGMKLDDIDRMTNRELQKNLRDNRLKIEKIEQVSKEKLRQKDAEIDRLETEINKLESNATPLTPEQIAERDIQNELEDLRRNLFLEINQVRQHFNECMRTISAAQAIEGVTFAMLEKWAMKEYTELKEFGPMLEDLDNALLTPHPGKEEDNAD